MISRFIMSSLLAVALFPLGAAAQDSTKVNAEIIKKAVESKFTGVKVESVAKTAYGGLYEVRTEVGDLVYTDDKVSFIVSGSIIDAKTKENVTDERKRKLSAIKFETLPLELAMKQVRGNGKRIVATFEDPNCGYCKQLQHDLTDVTDVTIYTFLYPILAADSGEKSKAIWCSANPVQSWNDWMRNGVMPATASSNCSAPMDKVVELGAKLRVTGTPTMFFANGERIPGAITRERFEQMLNDGAKQASAAPDAGKTTAKN
jgi:thiol:disulfide interchange protein DsbC